MRAVRCNAYGSPESLVVEDIAPLAPGDGEVLIELKASGVNFPDSLIIQNKYQIKPPLPFMPACELACAALHSARTHYYDNRKAVSQ